LALAIGAVGIAASIPGLDDMAGAGLAWFVIFLCAPLVAAGGGLVVLALARAYAPGTAPVWRRATGWLLLAFAFGYVTYPIWESMRSGQGLGLGELAFAMVLMAIPSGLVAWLGLTLARPKP